MHLSGRQLDPRKRVGFAAATAGVAWAPRLDNLALLDHCLTGASKVSRIHNLHA
jgi:hypothetical protein